MTAKYTAASLEDIAKAFDRNANISEGMAAHDTNIRRAAVSTAEARTWRSAAEILRNTTLAPAS